MKKKLHKIFAFVMVAIVSLLFVGCGPDSDNAARLKEQYENGQITYEEYLKKRQEGMSVPLYGTKILYRPDDYDWEGNVGEGNQNYYARYAWWLMRELVAVYGYSNENDYLVQNSTTNDETNQYSDIVMPVDNSKLGFYDSLRYQLNGLDNITLKKVVVDNEGNLVVDSPENDETNYLEISASTNNNWNWSLGLQAKYDESNPIYSFLTQDTKLFDENESITIAASRYPTSYYYLDGKTYLQYNPNTIKNALFGNSTDYYNENAEYWNISTPQGLIRSQNYLHAILQTEEINDDDYIDFSTYQYGDYVKALEYAIYCINLDLVPNAINVSYDSNGMPIVGVVGYDATEGKSSAQVALESIQDIFKKIGTYVGVTERQQVKLVNWICENIIGSSSASTFEITSNDITLVQYVKLIDIDGDGETEEVMGRKVGEEDFEFPEEGVGVFDPQEESRSANASIVVDRRYRDNVKAIVDICTTQVQIGGSNDEGGQSGPNIDQRYLASHVVDYYGDDSFVSGNNEFKGEPLEYQSMVLMFKQDFKFSNILLAFKYDAGLDGDNIVDPNASLTINIHLNLYTRSLNRYRPIGMIQNKQFYTIFQVRIKDGGYDFGGDSTIQLFDLIDRRPEGDNGVVCGKFNRNIGDGILASINDGYTGLQDVGTPLPLNGNDARRNYYTHIENEDEFTYSSYGVLNHEMFAGTDGCDYFEIAFEVVKDKGNTTKNYKFQTGLLLVA